MFPNVTTSDLAILITALAAFFGGMGTFLDNRRKARADDAAKTEAAKQLGVDGNQSWVKLLTDGLIASEQRSSGLRSQVTELETQLSAVKQDKNQQDDKIHRLQRSDSDKERRIKVLEEENQTLRKENAALKRDNAELKRDNAELKRDNAAIRQENHRIEEDNQRIKEQMRKMLNHLRDSGQPVPEGFEVNDPSGIATKRNEPTEPST